MDCRLSVWLPWVVFSKTVPNLKSPGHPFNLPSPSISHRTPGHSHDFLLLYATATKDLQRLNGIGIGLAGFRQVYKLLAIFPVPFVAPLVPVRSEAVPEILLCDEHENKKQPASAIRQILSFMAVFIIAIFDNIKLRHIKSVAL